jgi:hypothetical protein
VKVLDSKRLLMMSSNIACITTARPTGNCAQPIMTAGTTLAAGADGEEESEPEGESEPEDILMGPKYEQMKLRLKQLEALVQMNLAAEAGSVVSAMTASTVTPEYESFVRENLRRFVMERVFPSWKFIFKPGPLGQVVLLAISKKIITLPPGMSEAYMEEQYRHTIRVGLDGCRANAQTIARRRCIGKLQGDC